MAIDGAFLSLLTEEFSEIINCKIDKIHQPSRDELVFLLRKAGFSGRLFVSIKSGRARINLSTERPENPAQPPMFCMLLRKHLTGAKILEITQEGFERIITIRLSALNEMGDTVSFSLICELISNQANLILVDQNGKIVDAMRRSDIETAKRIIHPGAAYLAPEKQQKLSLLENDARFIADSVFTQTNTTCQKAFINCVDGISPLIAREISFSSQVQDCTTNELTTEQKERFMLCVAELQKTLKSGGKPTIILKDNVPFDFSYMPITQYGSEYKLKVADSFSSLLDSFYSALDKNDRIKNYSQEISRLLKNTENRIIKKIQIRSSDLKKTENREQLRIFGELIKANLHLIKAGEEKAYVQNYYDDNLEFIEIPLNPALSPAQNAAKYFKDYKRANTARQLLTKLIEEDGKELAYIESVADALSRAENVSDINEIKEELMLSGYLRRQKTSSKINNQSKFLEFKSPDGFKILVGKNNRQNDLLTTKMAQKNDMWFHTKNIPGSHVIVFCAGQELSEETVIFAAKLAAKNSKAKDSASVPVDYTPVKFVKKPAGAKPGMVIYTTNKTVYVTPEVE